MPDGCWHAEGIGRKQGGPEQPQACIGFLFLSALVDLVGRDSECVLVKVLADAVATDVAGRSGEGRYVMPDSGNLHLATACRDFNLGTTASS